MKEAAATEAIGVLSKGIHEESKLVGGEASFTGLRALIYRLIRSFWQVGKWGEDLPEALY